MATVSNQLQKAAERMAADAFEANVEELMQIAGDDLDAIHEAIEAVRTRAKAAGTPEHIAFTLLAAAWRRIADDRRAPRRATS